MQLASPGTTILEQDLIARRKGGGIHLGNGLPGGTGGAARVAIIARGRDVIRRTRSFCLVRRHQERHACQHGGQGNDDDGNSEMASLPSLPKGGGNGVDHR